MKLEVNGVEYEQFISATAEIRLDALSNSFSFTSAGENKSRPPFKKGDAVRVIVNNENVLAGNIEIVAGNYDSESHTFTYSGRDKTGDLVDSTVSAISDLKAPITLKQVIEKVLDNLGLDLVVIDNANPESFKKAEDITAPEPGENAFGFIEALARKRQVLLTSNADGNIVIEQTPGATLIHTLQNLNGADNNNILSASFSYDDTGRFNVYQMVSGLNPTSLSFAGTVPNADIVNQKSKVIDSAIRVGRQLIMTPEGSYSDTENEKRAKWESRIRQARGQLYSAIIQGHITPDIGDLWKVNTVVGVLDDFASIQAEMLINSVSYRLDTDSGSTTTLSLVEQNAYNLELSEPQTQNIGSGFAF